MRRIVKVILSVAIVAVASGSLSAIAAKKTQRQVSEQQKACYAECKSNKDSTAYEGCMIKCNQAEKERLRKAAGK